LREEGGSTERARAALSPPTPALPPCQVVTYFRYYRFLPPAPGSGPRSPARCFYRTTPDPPARAVPALAAGPPPPGSRAAARGAERVQEGRWRLGARGRVRVAVRHDNAAGTEIRTKLRLRSRAGCDGAWNRLDVLSLTSFDRASGVEVGIDRGGGDGGAAGNAQPGTLSYARGLSTYVFIPWAGVADHVLNLPLSQMDCFIPG